jgi:hypothetical protein
MSVEVVVRAKVHVKRADWFTGWEVWCDCCPQTTEFPGRPWGIHPRWDWALEQALAHAEEHR